MKELTKEKNFYKNNIHYFLLLIFILTPIFVMCGNCFNIDLWPYINIPVIVYGVIQILRNYKNKKYFPLYFFLFITFISCCFAEHKFDAFFGDKYRHEGLVTYIGYFGYFVIGNNLIDKKHNKIFVNILIAVALFISIITLLRIDITFTLLNISKYIEYYFYQGPFYHFNHFGHYLLIVTIITMCLFIYSKKTKETIIILISHIILLYTLIINDSFGVYLSYFAIIILFIILSIIKKSNLKKCIVILGIFILLSLVTYRFDHHIHIVGRNIKELIHDSNVIKKHETKELYSVGTNRLGLWIETAKLIKKKPLLGYGLEQTPYEYRRIGIYDSSKVHSLILELCFNSGIPAMILYFYIVLSIVLKKIKEILLIKDYKKIDKSSLICLFAFLGYLLSLMISNKTFYVSPYYYVLLGFIGQKYYKDKYES